MSNIWGTICSHCDPSSHVTMARMVMIHHFNNNKRAKFKVVVPEKLRLLKNKKQLEKLTDEQIAGTYNFNIYFYI